jgi:hypothetical protein
MRATRHVPVSGQAESAPDHSVVWFEKQPTTVPSFAPTSCAQAPLRLPTSDVRRRP